MTKAEKIFNQRMAEFGAMSPEAKELDVLKAESRTKKAMHAFLRPHRMAARALERMERDAKAPGP